MVNDQDTFGANLITAAAARYRHAGLWAWRLAANKLRMDPVYLQVLRSGALPDDGAIVDLGCGRGLMLALIAAARAQHASGDWPVDWPVPPRGALLVGIERRRHVADLAKTALGRDAMILESDITTAEIPPCRCVLAFDVLHLLPPADQDRVLAVCADALDVGGVLFLREADASADRRFGLVRFGNRVVAALQGQARRPFHYRTADDWRRVLETRGFAPSPAPRIRASAREGANVLIQARLR